MSKARGSYRVDPLGHKKKSPVLLNGLTEAETNATASVMGLVEQKVLEHAPCLGMNCGITRTDQMHSAECQAEHAATIAGGKFVKPAQQEPVGCIPSHWVDKAKQIADGPIAYPGAERAQQAIALIKILLKSTPPARKPLTHEQRVDLLAKFEAHKHEWHAPAILIDMVEAAHNIKETP